MSQGCKKLYNPKKRLKNPRVQSTQRMDPVAELGQWRLVFIGGLNPSSQGWNGECSNPESIAGTLENLSDKRAAGIERERMQPEGMNSDPLRHSTKWAIREGWQMAYWMLPKGEGKKIKDLWIINNRWHERESTRQQATRFTKLSRLGKEPQLKREKKKCKTSSYTVHQLI